MTISTINDIVTGLTVAQRINLFKSVGTLKAAGAFQSSWLSNGWPVAGAAAPAFSSGSDYTCDKGKQGAIPYANGAVQNWLAKMSVMSTITGMLYLYDRLWSCSGMGYAATTYTVNTPGALPARITDNGLGCELWIENFVAAGAASNTMTCNYVEPGGGGEVGVIQTGIITSAPVAGQMQPVPLQNGSVGIKQLTNVINGATWTSGTWGMTICKFIAAIPIAVANAGYILDWALLGLPPIPADACLFGIWQGSTTTAPVINFNLSIIDK